MATGLGETLHRCPRNGKKAYNWELVRDMAKVCKPLIANRLWDFRISRYFGTMATWVGETRHRLTLEATSGMKEQKLMLKTTLQFTNLEGAVSIVHKTAKNSKHCQYHLLM